MIRLLLVDDHALMRQALALLLAQEPDMIVVAEAGSVTEARWLHPTVDVAIVDLDLLAGAAPELIDELRTANPAAQLLVLGAATDRHRLAAAVMAGAVGAVAKTGAMETLLAAIRQVAAGEPLLTPEELVELRRLAGQRHGSDRAPGESGRD